LELKSEADATFLSPDPITSPQDYRVLRDNYVDKMFCWKKTSSMSTSVLPSFWETDHSQE